MGASLDDLGDYEALDMQDFPIRRLFVEINQSVEAAEFNMSAIRKFVRDALTRIVVSFGTSVLVDGRVDDKLWKFDFEGDRILVQNIFMHIKEGIKIVFNNSDGIIFKATENEPLKDGKTCFHISAPIGELERFARGKSIEVMGHDVAICDMSLSQVIQISEWNNEYRADLLEELHFRLSVFFETVFGISNSDSMDVICSASITMVGDKLIVDELVPRSAYYFPLYGNDEASYCLYTKDIDGDVTWCSLTIPCDWIDEVSG